MQIKLKRVMHFLIALPEQLGLTMVRLKKKSKWMMQNDATEDIVMFIPHMLLDACITHNA